MLEIGFEPMTSLLLHLKFFLVYLLELY